MSGELRLTPKGVTGEVEKVKSSRNLVGRKGMKSRRVASRRYEPISPRKDRNGGNALCAYDGFYGD